MPSPWLQCMSPRAFEPRSPTDRGSEQYHDESDQLWMYLARTLREGEKKRFSAMALRVKSRLCLKFWRNCQYSLCRFVSFSRLMLFPKRSTTSLNSLQYRSWPTVELFCRAACIQPVTNQTTYRPMDKLALRLTKKDLLHHKIPAYQQLRVGFSVGRVAATSQASKSCIAMCFRKILTMELFSQIFGH